MQLSKIGRVLDSILRSVPGSILKGVHVTVLSACMGAYS